MKNGMKQVLLAWIGQADLDGPNGSRGAGPIAQALDSFEFDEARLLCNYGDYEPFAEWLQARTKTPFHIQVVSLSSPTEYSQIYKAAVHACAEVLEGCRGDAALTFHLSPGTPAMQAMWILIGSARYRGRFLETSRERGPRVVEIPFEISAEFLPDLLKPSDRKLAFLSDARPPEHPAFAEVLCRSRAMSRVVEKAQQVAMRRVPVLIEGETGTGKELLARAIHEASPRREGPFITVNCGALPADLIEAELFGHEKGAFTGAAGSRTGYFECSDGGTLFLDEIGELPLSAQVKILRCLQEEQVTRLGSTEPIDLDLRVIAATNRSLILETQEGRFREDLFYRLAVALLKLPPLREREGDIGLLLDRLLGSINREMAEDGAFKPRRLSAGARNVFLNHSWPGNVRELLNTLRRAVVWSTEEVIGKAEAREALMLSVVPAKESILGRALGDGFSIQDTIAEVARHYLERAMADADGNKTRAAELVGLNSYQTLTGWLERYEVDAVREA